MITISEACLSRPIKHLGYGDLAKQLKKKQKGQEYSSKVLDPKLDEKTLFNNLDKLGVKLSYLLRVSNASQIAECITFF